MDNLLKFLNQNVNYAGELRLNEADTYFVFQSLEKYKNLYDELKVAVKKHNDTIRFLKGEPNENSF